MRILFIALILLTAGVAKAEQSSWRYHLPIDEMMGEKDYRGEKVLAGVKIESQPSWGAALLLFCGDGDLTFTLNQFGNSDVKPVKLDEVKGVVTLRLKFDNNEPFFIPWEIPEQNPGRVNLPSYPDLPEINNMRKKIIKGMIKHRRLWIGFEVHSRPYIAKFDLTGFSVNWRSAQGFLIQIEIFAFPVWIGKVGINKG